MNERIQKLRAQSINTKPSISPERALLVTEFYKSDRNMAMMTMRRTR